MGSSWTRFRTCVPCIGRCILYCWNHQGCPSHIFLILQYSTLKSTVVKNNSWPPGACVTWTSKKSYWLEEGEEVGDGGTEGSSAIGDGGQASMSLLPDFAGAQVCILKVQNSNVYMSGANCVHHFMGNRWGNSGNSVRLYFWGPKITAVGDCSHEIKRHLLLGRKVMTNLDGILKSRDIT